MIWPGEKEAWDIILNLESKDVETRSGASFTHDTSVYALRCFNEDINISLSDKAINSSSPLGRILLTKIGEYSRLSILGYLIQSKNLPLSGRLIKPSDMPDGDFFLKGAHVLPMDKITGRFENNYDEFLYVGKDLGGSQVQYGDVSLKVYPFPRVPVFIILWSGDDEFPSRSSLLFDSSCVSHMAVDILWATAMMTIEMMLIP